MKNQKKKIKKKQKKSVQCGIIKKNIVVTYIAGLM